MKIFSFFRKPKTNGNGVVTINERQKYFDKKLVHSLSRSRIPNWRQIRYAGKILNRREMAIVKICIAVLVITTTVWAGAYYFRHLQVTPVKGGTYKEAMLGMPKYINPLYYSLSDVDNDMGLLIFSSLYKRGQSGALEPDLVLGTTVSEDARAYTIKITDQAIWHDDKPLTANDVVFTFNAIKNPQYKSTLRSSFEGVEIEKVGDYEVIFRLNEPYAAFLDLLTFGIIPAHLWSQIPPDSALLAELNLKPIGSGLFRFDSLSKDKNGSIKEYSLIANEKYYAKQPLIDLELFFFNSIEEAINALNTETVNGISYLPFNEKEAVLTPNSFTFEKLSLPQITLIFFNQKNNPALQDKAVRQALAFGIDRNQIVNEVLLGNAYLSNGPILNNSFAYDPSIKTYDHNIEEAGRLLDSVDWKMTEIKAEQIAAAGSEIEDEAKRTAAEMTIFMGEGNWRVKDGKYLIINLKTVDRGENAAVIGKISEFWAKLGVKANIEIVPITNLQDDVIRPRNFDAFFYGQILGADPDPYVFWHSSQTGENGFNIAGFANKEVDELLEDARLNSDVNFRQEKYKRFQAIIADEEPAIFMYSPVYTYVHSNKLKGFSVSSILLPRDRFSNIDDWYLKTGKRFVW